MFVLGNSTDGSCYHSIILTLIKKAHDVGIVVVNVTTDMGAPNRAMWSTFNIHVMRHSPPSVSILHPVLPDRKLYFLTDVPHAIKNLKESLVKADIRFNDKVVSMEPVRELVKLDSSRDLKLAPKLKQSDIAGGHFSKMKVSSAMHVFSNSVSAGLKFMVKHNLIQPKGQKVALDTAWFIDKMNRWFDLMSSRSVKLALSKHDVVAYDSAITFLKEVVSMFSAISIGDGRWKPVQTAVILSTESVIKLSDEVLAHGTQFLMTSRLTQDCLENLFSTVRLKTATPSPVEFRNSLKIILVAQFLKTPTTSSYDVDESTYLINYLESARGESDHLDDHPEEVN